MGRLLSFARMHPIKGIERWAKRVLASAATALLGRPRAAERGNPSPETPLRVLLVRIDDRVGEALLLTPLFLALKTRPGSTEVHALIHDRCERVLRGHPHLDRLIPFDRRLLFLGPLAPGIRPLRRQNYDVVVDCGNWAEPSVTSALISRLIGFRSTVVGPAVASVSGLRTVSLAARSDTRSEVRQRLHLISPLTDGRGEIRPTFRSPRIAARFRPFLEELRSTPFAVVNPGGRLGWRRIPVEGFAGAADALLASGLRPVLSWGPGEESLVASIARLAPGSLIAPETDLDDLAATLEMARLSVCNNSGPMHLSVAVGTPTLGLFLRMDPERWGHPYAPHRMLELTSFVDAGDDLRGIVAAEVNRFMLFASDRNRDPARPGSRVDAP